MRAPPARVRSGAGVSRAGHPPALPWVITIAVIFRDNIQQISEDDRMSSQTLTQPETRE